MSALASVMDIMPALTAIVFVAGLIAVAPPKLYLRALAGVASVLYLVAASTILFSDVPVSIENRIASLVTAAVICAAVALGVGYLIDGRRIGGVCLCILAVLLIIGSQG